MQFDHKMIDIAESLLERFRAAQVKIVTAESCTGGLISALLTSVAGSSDVLERGFVTYSNEAKRDLLNVSQDTLARFGAVSAETVSEMANGALSRSRAQVSAAVTGIAGPGGGSQDKPVGLVFVAVAAASGTYVEEFRFGDIGRDGVRIESVKMALEMLVSYGLDTPEQ